MIRTSETEDIFEALKNGTSWRLNDDWFKYAFKGERDGPGVLPLASIIEKAGRFPTKRAALPIKRPLPPGIRICSLPSEIPSCVGVPSAPLTAIGGMERSMRTPEATAEAPKRVVIVSPACHQHPKSDIDIGANAPKRGV